MKPIFKSLPPVSQSRDLVRIKEIPRRPQPSDVELDALVEKWTRALSRHGAGCDCRIRRLLPQQAWALEEAGPADGLLALMGVGSGKTLVWILLPLVMESKRAALLLPPGLVEQFVRDYDAAWRHFAVPDLEAGEVVRVGTARADCRTIVVPYSRLQMPEASARLRELDVDLVMADEMHALKRMESARTRRVARALADRPGTRFGGGTGSAITDTICDLGHLAAFALGDSSPLPHEPSVLAEWANATDPTPWRAPPGRLLDLGGADAREAVRRRIYETRGVVCAPSRGGAVASLVMRDRQVPVPPAVKSLMAGVRTTWCRPDGEEFVDPVRVRECLMQLGCGFYQRWRFPGVVQSLVDEWMDARRDWHRELRRRLEHPREGMDSPELCRRAAARYHAGYEGDLPTWRADSWPRWDAVRARVPHEVEVVWVDDFLAADAAEWARAIGVVWYRHAALGERISALSGLPLHVGSPATLRAEKGQRSVVLSSLSYGQGWDGLQHLFDRQLVCEPPPSWEQLLGRLNRVGQRADEVVTEVSRHTPELRDAIDRALEEAKFASDLGGPQLMLAADVEWALRG